MPLRAALLLALALQSAPQPAWQHDLEVRHQALIDGNGPGTDPALRDQLLAMAATDQQARGFGPDGKRTTIAGNLAEVDRQLTAQLKQIAESKGWPTIRLVGLDASNAAMLILAHTPDHAWQHALLPQLEQLADGNRIDGAALALVIDKDLVANGQLQRYGSQFKEVNGSLAMYAVEDPANLDRRRAQILLQPIEAYRQALISMYHLKPSNQIVTPPAPKP